MSFSESCFQISNPTLRRKLSFLAAYGNTVDAIKKTLSVRDTHCFEVWADGKVVETICLKLGSQEATQLEKEIAVLMSQDKK